MFVYLLLSFRHLLRQLKLRIVQGLEDGQVLLERLVACCLCVQPNAFIFMWVSLNLFRNINALLLLLHTLPFSFVRDLGIYIDSWVWPHRFSMQCLLLCYQQSMLILGRWTIVTQFLLECLEICFNFNATIVFCNKTRQHHEIITWRTVVHVFLHTAWGRSLFVSCMTHLPQHWQDVNIQASAQSTLCHFVYWPSHHCSGAFW